MTPAKWMLLALGGAAVIGYTVWWYRTREEPVRGRGWASALRAAALILILLIFLNPTWPRAWERGADEVAVLVDASLSMTRPSVPGGPTLWSLAIDSARGRARGRGGGGGGGEGGVWLFGGATPSFTALDSMPDVPGEPGSRLAPAVRAAALAGARSAIVYSDGGIVDVQASVEEAQRLGLSLQFVISPPRYASFGIAQVRSPVWVQSGDSVRVEIDVVAAPAAPAAPGPADSILIEIVDDRGRPQASERIPVPEAGRFSTLALSFEVAGQAGQRRFSVRISGETGDPEVRDDTRPFYLKVSEQAVGPVLISLQPDWEPSFLIPSLDRVTDGGTRAYYWLTDSLVSLDGFRPASIRSVGRQARAAPLLVMHGYSATAPEWAQALVREADRLLILPAGAAPFDLPGLGVRVQAPRSGEWYAAENVPPSPLALELVGFSAEALPPLLRVRSVLADAGWSPLSLRRMRRGEETPVIVAGITRRRRWAVATAEGYWRWAFRPGSGRQLYRALWTGLAGWLVEGRGSGESGLEPNHRVVGRGEPLEWVAPSGVDSVRIDIRNERGDVVRTLGIAPGDSVNPILPPGRYDYSAQAFRDGRVAASSSGPTEVEEFSPELLPSPVVDPRSLQQISSAQGATGPDEGTRRLATMGWAYVLLILIFTAEWVVRRRIGLL